MYWHNNKKLTVINFFGGPGTGKSTLAAALFAKMKKEGGKVELNHEVAKDLMWERLYETFSEQDYIFALQHHMLRRLVDRNIDYVIVDSPLLFSLFYMPFDFPPSFRQFVEDVFYSYDNINIFLDRHDSVPYVQTGRNETEEQAKVIDNKMLQYFEMNKGRIDFKRVTVGVGVVDTCSRLVKSHIKPSLTY
jgi:RecA/RadA recombinase